jgi:hypothetical protein
MACYRDSFTLLYNNVEYLKMRLKTPLTIAATVKRQQVLAVAV